MRGQVAALALIAATSPALADDATAEGARGIEDAYAAYFGRQAIVDGVIKAEPDGDAYVISWDLGKAASALGAPADALKMDPFTYRLKPEADDGWSWSGLALPRISLKASNDKGPSSADVNFDGFSLAGRWDPSHEPFLVTKLALGAVNGDFAQTDPNGISHIHWIQNDLSLETRAQTNSAGGVDVALVQSVGKLTETVTPPDGQGGAAAEVKLESDFAPGGAAITGLRAREIGALWRTLAAAADSGAAPQGLAELMTAALPLWNDMGAEVRLQNIKIDSAFGGGEIAGFGETVKLAGLGDEGRVEFGVDLDGLTLQSPMAPPWIARLTPLSTKIAVALTDSGVGNAARIALADAKFGEQGQVSEQAQAAIDAALLAGDPRLVLLPGRLTNPTIDLAFEGSAELRPGAVAAEMKISADSLDKALAMASELGAAAPEMQGAVLILGLVKGLATTQADGRLFWDVVVDGPKVTVNGSPLPTSP